MIAGPAQYVTEAHYQELRVCRLLVGGVLARPAAHADMLYTDKWELARQAAERNGLTWRILSAWTASRGWATAAWPLGRC